MSFTAGALEGLELPVRSVLTGAKAMLEHEQ